MSNKKNKLNRRINKVREAALGNHPYFMFKYYLDKCFPTGMVYMSDNKYAPSELGTWKCLGNYNSIYYFQKVDNK